MALFHRYATEEPGFTNLFRMLDAFDNYNTQVRPQSRHQNNGHSHGHRAAAAAFSSFNPKFDVRETETSYELHGELPGVSRDDISINFTDNSQTLTVSGRTERTYSSGTPPAGLVAQQEQQPAAVTEGGEEHEKEEQHPSHKATVADEEAEAAKEKGEEASVAVATPTSETTTTTEQPKQPSERYWHQERTVGSFQRTFTFAAPVDEAGATAKLRDGILHLSIPKVAKREARRINIE